MMLKIVQIVDWSGKPCVYYPFQYPLFPVPREGLKNETSPILRITLHDRCPIWWIQIQELPYPNGTIYYAIYLPRMERVKFLGPWVDRKTTIVRYPCGRQEWELCGDVVERVGPHDLRLLLRNPWPFGHMKAAPFVPWYAKHWGSWIYHTSPYRVQEAVQIGNVCSNSRDGSKLPASKIPTTASPYLNPKPFVNI